MRNWMLYTCTPYYLDGTKVYISVNPTKHDTAAVKAQYLNTMIPGIGYVYSTYVCYIT